MFILINNVPMITRADVLNLSKEYQNRLNRYATATIRYFTSPKSNNLKVGFPHAFFGTGKFQVLDDGIWREEKWDLTRGYGSHVNINEVTLRFVCLGVAYKMGWLNYLPSDERYNMSWGQILKGLQTLRYMQTSGNSLQFHQGHFHRTYLTTINRNDDYDLDRSKEEIVRPDHEDIQSSDDNALPFMNLCLLEGLARDQSVNIPNRNTIIQLCMEIRSSIDLKSFIINNRIVHNFQNGVASNEVWDRLSTEGAIISAALLLSDQISISQFYQITKGLKNYPVDWATHSGELIHIKRPSYHSAMFMHGLRMIHGMPTTNDEFTGLDYFVQSLKPIVQAQIKYAQNFGFMALGTQVMSQTIYGIPLFVMNNKQVQFPGNEDNVMPVPEESLSKGTGTHAWFMPLARWRYLSMNNIDKIFAWIDEYESDFFHSGSDTELGWEATIPWTPSDKSLGWEASDGTWRYTDWGRPYEALNSAYILLSIFDALNPDKPLASYHTLQKRLNQITFYLDNRTETAPRGFMPSLYLLLQDD